MENLGKKIADYRKKLNLTQKALGDMLNLSPQAISKWENGQAEPDADTIKKLCEIFKISTDEFLDNLPPAEEAAATASETFERQSSLPDTGAPAQQPKIICGYCDLCNKPVSNGEYMVMRPKTRGGAQQILCLDCRKKVAAQERIDEQNRKNYEYSKFKSTNVKSIIWGAVVGVAVLVIFALSLTLAGDMPASLAVPFAIVFGIAGFSFTMQMFWDGAVNDLFFFFLKSFKMPGVIFTLDLDGILFLIFVKLFGAILGAILSVVFFLLGMIITPLGSVFILPFAAIKRSIEGAKLKKEASQITEI